MGKLDALAALVGSGPIQADPVVQVQASSVPVLKSKADMFKALKTVEAQLNKQFDSKVTLVRLGDRVGHVMPSLGGDLPTFDYGVIGTGGIPKGRLIEWFGNEGGGKTTLALHYVAKEQARGGVCAYIDSEHALDPNYMAQLGVDVNELVVAQLDSLEESIETVEALVDARAVTLIVVDSVAALTPAAELAGDSGDSFMGLQARLMGQAMRKLRGKCAVSGIPVIWVNQLRTNLGQTYGNPNVTPGGKALKFFASLRVDISKVGGDDGKIKSGGIDIGHKVRLRAVKNKVGSPAKVTEIDLIYGLGFDTKADTIEYGVSVGAIQQSGAWFTFGEHRAQGKAQLKTLLKDNPEAMTALRAEIEKAQAAQREADKQ